MGAYPDNFGETLRKERNLLGMSREEVADFIDCSPETVKNAENGVSKSPALFRKMVDFYNAKRPANNPFFGFPKTIPTGSAWLDIPLAQWGKNLGPSSLLEARYAVVPWHGEQRKGELDALIRWCRFGERVAVRFFKGAGGMGKTRLALELCRSLCSIDPGKWTAGFLVEKHFPARTNPWEMFSKATDSYLVVVDYAGEPSKHAILTRLIETLDSCPGRTIRLLLLDRDDIWLGRFPTDGKSRKIISDLRFGGNELNLALPPVAVTREERQNSHKIAAKAFSEKLEIQGAKSSPLNPSRKIYDQVLLIHIHALLSLNHTSTEKVASTENSLLSNMILRESEFWRRNAVAFQVPLAYLPAMEKAVYAIGINRGASGIKEAVSMLRNISVLSNESNVLLSNLATAIRSCYPSGKEGISPLQPDLLVDFLGERLLKDGWHISE